LTLESKPAIITILTTENKMKIGNLVRDLEYRHGEIGVIVAIKHIEMHVGNIYVIHFSNSGERWLLATEMEVIK
jgi:hypothetical protein